MLFAKKFCSLVGAAMLLGTAVALAQEATVKAHVIAASQSGAPRDYRDSSVVVWLIPMPSRTSSVPFAQNSSPHPKLIQKNKHFEPHVLAVQVNSEVDFPNRDPFFHNVFSLFGGKRFDLGLYEAGSTRSIRFDRPGICYIFCNIHPQMSAVVVVVDTPYFSVSGNSGEIVIPHVPAGRYQLNVWEEHCAPKTLKELSHPVTVGEATVSLGTIHLKESRDLVMAHPNKYARNYDPQVFSSPIYVQP